MGGESKRVCRTGETLWPKEESKQEQGLELELELG
jgi:hypothetical protein